MKSKKRNLYLIEAFGILLGLIWLSPFYLILVNAFKTKKEIFTNVLGLPTEMATENFSRAFEDLDFIKSLGNSLLITVCSIIIIVVFSSMGLDMH